MTEPLLITRQRELLNELHCLIRERSVSLPRIERDFEIRNASAEKEFHETCQRVIDRFESEKQAAQSEFQATQDRVSKRFTRERGAQDEELRETQQRVTTQFEAESLAARNAFQAARAASIKTYENNQRVSEEGLELTRQQLDEAIRRRKRIERDTVRLLEEWRQDPEHEGLPPAGRPDRKYKDAFRQLEDCLATAESLLSDLRALRLPRFFKGWRPAWLFLLLFLIIGGIASLTGGLEYWIMGLAGGAAASMIVGAGICFWLHSRARRQIDLLYLPLLRALVEADETVNKAVEQSREQYQRKLAGFKKLHDKELREASEKLEAERLAMEKRRDAQLGEAKEKFDRLKGESIYRRDADLRQAHEKYQRLRTEIFQRYEGDSHQIHQRRYGLMAESKERYGSEWKALIENWQQGLAQIHQAAEAISRECHALFPDWTGSAWAEWHPPTRVPPVIPFGYYTVDLAQLPGGLPEDDRFKPAVPTRFSLPALLPFPSKSCLVVRAGGEGRAAAVGLLQAVMLRYLTALPPGKVRFTIIDPVGLGENFAAFMHLADYDEALVNSRIWTEIGHIEQRLSDLSTHMEDVIQKYLRNQYKTIEEYNAQAGEVAEPYRIPVVANFPSNFTAEAARRLVSIVSSGARCGVYVLLSLDTAQDLPLGFQPEALDEYAVRLDAGDNGLVWKDPDFERYPLEPDRLPDDERCTRILHQVGKWAQEASRVEVPFEFIAAPPEVWWRQDSRAGVNVALGRAGATKRQHLKLGEGTSQHVLVAGKTGSGKSTLLHALITNVSLLYSPDEIELYLIDFKKGVEFRTYAAHHLPHARVVAIESDREFGLSVLQKLDLELKQRGDRFRKVGAQDLAAYRELNGSDRMPRILLIVDEFQEFFVEDDKVSQDATQLLDRLVRQGRAFGLHVLLGSQTLGGAYTLARSTIDQMAVRIALQCSEADGHLILSDDNSAARLLSRPGEAIYNDANGLVEGNNPFQVVWLPEARREEFLEQVRQLDRRHHPGMSRPQIVFEGNVPAELSKNQLLLDEIGGSRRRGERPGWQAWMGEPMAIKDPTAAVFRRQTGNNLLMIGQYDEAALGILTSAIISLAAQHTTPGLGGSPAARFCVLDGTPADADHAGYLASLIRFIPQPLQVSGWRDVAGLMSELAAEATRWQENAAGNHPEIYLIINGLHRFRDLRKEEDDFGFSSSEEKPSPAKHFARILREGSGVGIHVLLWCDTFTNVSRVLDRHALREFSLRVLFQMSPSDSSTLIDSPAASKLGPHRAYFHNEDEGKLEKFRPYGLPAGEWLAWFRQQWTSRAVPPEPQGVSTNR